MVPPCGIDPMAHRIMSRCSTKELHLALTETNNEEGIQGWREQGERKFMKKYFSFQPVLHDWCNKGRGMCYPVCGMVHIKEPLLLIDKSSLCGDSGFPFSLSEWSLTICLTPYNRR